ncbi:kynurenine 3-monooxygenase [Stylonychia lemnae]|uniref:Kynurenine 3-monooxygenase n=1 Tax=Stylonychia lemnae TaxID=5949 RepID=A0A078AHB6_STYLE|nr:kynurenine 3-monooxygenase [Stylonychia lemnae]|eukprot:CDW81680.1 kynurenine 3-monooxygenase [Stylonychia lemnae]
MRQSEILIKNKGQIDLSLYHLTQHLIKRFMEKNNRLAIIGAGPVGSVLSILFAQKGYNIELFEKRPNPLETIQSSEWRSTNFILGLRSHEALQRCGVFEEIQKFCVRLDQMKFILQNQDEFDIYFGGKTEKERSYSINRAEIQKVLARRIKDFSEKIEVNYSTKVFNVDVQSQTFQAIYQDGKVQQKGDYEQIFAADGTFSVVKQAFIQQPGFSYSIQYSGYGYTELQIPAMIDENGGRKFRVQENTFFNWARNGLDMSMMGMPNYEGDINIGLYLKVKGENSFEYFKQDFKLFEEFMHKNYPDTKYLMPNMKEFYDNSQITRLLNMKCSPWNFGNLLLIGDSAHSMNPFSGQGFNGSMEECVLIADLFEKFRGDWSKINPAFFQLRKDVTDKMNDFPDAQFSIIKDKFNDPDCQIGIMITDYLCRLYGDVFDSQNQLIRWTTTDYNICLGRGQVQAHLINELRQKVPEILILIKANQFDQRVYDIVSQYKGVHNLEEFLSEKNNQDQKKSQDDFENLFEKYMHGYQKNQPKL